jgi:hypothetical protein
MTRCASPRTCLQEASNDSVKTLHPKYFFTQPQSYYLIQVRELHGEASELNADIEDLCAEIRALCCDDDEL